MRFEPGVTVRNSSPSRFTAALCARPAATAIPASTCAASAATACWSRSMACACRTGFSFGPASFGRGDYVDLDLLQSRGNSARTRLGALWQRRRRGRGSFFTKHRSRRFSRSEDDDFGVRVRACLFASADDSWAEERDGRRPLGRLVGVRLHTHAAMVTSRKRRANSTQLDSRAHRGQSRKTSNRTRRMARVVFEPNDAHRFRLTADYGDRVDRHRSAIARRSIPPDGPAWRSQRHSILMAATKASAARLRLRLHL